MLTLDGVGASNCQRPFCVHSQLLTTASGNDVIVLVVETYCNTGISHINDSNGLNFTLRVSHANGCYGTLWEYYAISTARLNQDNITVLTDQCCNTIMGMQVLAVHEANTLGVFDPDPSTPTAVSCPGKDCGDCTANFGKGTCSVSIRTSTLRFCNRQHCDQWRTRLRASLSDGTSAGIHESDAEPERKVRGRLRNN